MNCVSCEPNKYLQAASFINSAHPEVVAFANSLAGSITNDIERARRLYAGVRDSIVYELYLDYRAESTYRASGVLRSGKGFCVGKAALLVACARATQIPARVGYADVRNHLTSPRLRALMGTDLFVWHSFAELWLNGKWVKATPAFDAQLCARIGISPLDFDGDTDALLHPYDPEGKHYMEYVTERGTFSDVPVDVITQDICTFYPKLVAAAVAQAAFQSEVAMLRE